MEPSWMNTTWGELRLSGFDFGTPALWCGWWWVPSQRLQVHWVKNGENIEHVLFCEFFKITSSLKSGNGDPIVLVG